MVIEKALHVSIRAAAMIGRIVLAIVIRFRGDAS